MEVTKMAMLEGRVIYENGKHKVVYYPGRMQPYTIWNGSFIEKFCDQVSLASSFYFGSQLVREYPISTRINTQAAS